LSTVTVGKDVTVTGIADELSTVTVGKDVTATGVADELSIVIVMDGSDSTFSEGIDDTDTVDVPSAFTVSELLVLLLPPDLLHIVSVKPRIATKNTCHNLSFHMIPPKLRLINT
jgi:hypothetical protein|tara:strand:- start:78 stop:419 length:342 start_codon:yes stop_codon:yes gene_type:complete